MDPDFFERLVPTPRGFDDAVKGKAARAERGWEAATGLFGALGATGTAALAAGAAIPPLAPFLGLVAASGFYFKLRAKWAKDDPPRPDFDVSVDWQPPRLDLSPVLPEKGIARGAGLPTLLHAAGAGVEATVLCVERAMGASEALASQADEAIRATLAARLREAHEHAVRTEMLAMALHDETLGLNKSLGSRASPAAGVAGLTLADAMDRRVRGRILATGLDPRLLSVSLRGDVDLSDKARGDVLDEAGSAAEALGVALRQWTASALADPSLS